AGNPGDPEHPESAEGEGSIEAQQVAAKAQTTFEPTPAERIIDARTAYIMTSMLQDVIKRGTGRRALALKRTDLAGKTGTTNDSKDGWFSGYNSDYVTSVWVGFDQPETLGRREYGGTVALP
ncbi:penicillin-binding transpeptidase domain-containing protein, partial [Klebsiella pneumoniae]